MKSYVWILSLVSLTGVGACAQSARPEPIASYFAVNPASSQDIITQINALTSTCGASCVIHVPAGKFRTQSSVPILLHAGQSLIGEGEQLTSISGNVAKMIVWHANGNAEFYVPAGKIADMSIHCGAATTECIDTGDLLQAHLESLVVDGAFNGDCIAITNTNHWFERSSFINLTVGSGGPATALCSVGIHLRKPAGGTNSYGYAYWPSIYQNSTSNGVQVDAGDLLYNASYIGIQSNQTGGFALTVGGLIQASFLSLTGEGPGGAIHVLKGGAVQGCGSLMGELHGNLVDGSNDDTHMPLDLTSCGAGSGTVMPDLLGEGKVAFTPQILHHSSTGEVNAGMFFTDNSTRMGGPAMLFTTGSHFTIGTKDLYNVIGSYTPKWWLDAGGNSGQVGAMTAANVKSGENVVPYAQTAVFSVAAQTNIVTLAGNLAGFALAAGNPGQTMTLTFCQGPRGGWSVAGPANVRGLGRAGTQPSTCSSQSFVYSKNKALWFASAPMVADE